jgi:sulfur carrier protein
VGGGFLRTGCGPGPLEPDLDNPSEGNTTNGSGRTLDGERPFVFITVNGKEMDVEPGMSVDGLLALLNIKREYTAVAVNREITPKSEYTSVKLGQGDKVEIVRPMGGGAR